MAGCESLNPQSINCLEKAWPKKYYTPCRLTKHSVSQVAFPILVKQEVLLSQQVRLTPWENNIISLQIHKIRAPPAIL